MRRFLLFVLLFAIVGSPKAQQPGQRPIDSLLRLLPAAKEDTTKTQLYYDIARNYVFIDPVKAMQYVDTGSAHAEKMKWEKGIALFHFIRGNVLSDQGKGEPAITEYKEGLAICRAIGYRSGIATAFNDIGGVYFRQSDYPQALSYFDQALKIGEEIEDDNAIGTSYTNFASVYYNQKNFPKAIEYNKKSLPFFERLGDPDKIARTVNYIGNTYLEQGDKQHAEEHYRRALGIYEKTNNQTGRAILYSQIAILYEPDYARIISFQQKSQAIWDSINPTHYNSIINLGNMGETYLHFIRADSLKKLSSAQRRDLLAKAGTSLERAIRYSRQTNDKDNLAYFSRILAEQQELAGDYKAAIANYKYGFTLQDSLYSQENKNRIASIESERSIALRDKQIELSKLAIAAQKKQRLALIAGLLLLVVIAGLIFWQSRIRKRVNTTLLRLNNELDESNKVKARFFAILSHDLRSPVASLISFLELQQEEPGILNAEQAAAHQKNISQSARALLETMEAMLLWSKGQMEQFKPELRAVPVRELFAYLQRSILSNGPIQLRFEDPDNLEVVTDENYLQTIMHNLTVNALRALGDSPSGVIAWTAKQEGEKTILSITDNGPGIRDDQVKALFDDAPVPNARTGFGLHLVRDLARAIHCQISMQSQPGSGTTFTLQT